MRGHQVTKLIQEIRARRIVAGLLGRKPRRGRVLRQQQPDAIRLAYFGALRAVLERARVLIHQRLIPRLPAYVQEAGVKLDAFGDDLNDLLDDIADDFFAEFSNARLTELATEYAQRTSSFQRAQLANQLQTALGVDLFPTEPWLGDRIQAFTAENVSLIKSIPTKFFGEVETRVIGGIRAGQRAEDLAAEIEDRFEVATSRAQLIARDQIGKFFGELNQVRQQELGIDGFVWRTAGDERVREEHQILDGKRFAWDDPPAEGIPGEPINCRCEAEPDLSSITQEATDE